MNLAGKRTRLIFWLGLSVFVFIGFANSAFALVGAPEILHHQGRLLDSDGDLQDGNFCFQFSIYDDAVVGGVDVKLWPDPADPNTMVVDVVNGVFDVGIGDMDAGGNELDFDFNETDEVFLNISVAAQVAGSCAGASFENLSPRQRIFSSGYAINAETVDGFSATQSATGDEIPVLTSDDLILGGADPSVGATGANALVLQGAGATGDIQFFSALNKLTSVGALTLAGSISTAGITSTGAIDFTGAVLSGASPLVFEGLSADGFETTLAITNPTADNTITFQNASGTVAYLSDIAAESDPVFGASDAAGITALDIVDWDTAFGWGDHTLAGYLTVESDPVFGASDAAGITALDIVEGHGIWLGRSCLGRIPDC